MPAYNSSRTTASVSSNGVFDPSGVSVVSSGNAFGVSPLGIAPRSQAFYGLPNAQFNLLPADVNEELADSENPLPYWSVNNASGGRIIAKSFYDTTTGTWSVELDPTTGTNTDFITLTTRGYILTDDNIALRQQAYLTTSKGTAYAGSTQFNVTLTSEYFDVNGNSLSSYAIGTALDNGTLTGISGITTSGSAAISAAAAYVDLTVKLTCTATVTSGVKVYLKSLLLATASAASSGSFQIAQAFTTSGSWTRPTGVDYVSVIAVGGGGGGGGGLLSAGTVQQAFQGCSGGGASRIAYAYDLYVGDVGTVSVGVGAGGSGGTSITYTKATGTTFATQANSSNASSGGASNFGTYITVNGGGGGNGGGTATLGNAAAGTAAGASTIIILGGVDTAGAAGGAGPTTSTIAGSPGGTATALVGITRLPMTGTAYYTAGANGAEGTATNTTGTAFAGTAGGTAGVAGWLGGGGSSGGGTANASGNRLGAGGAGGPGGGGGAGRSRYVYSTQAGTYVVTGGNGGNGGTYSGAGGGAGGASLLYVTTAGSATASNITMTSGQGGTGGGGFVIVVYTA